MFFVIKNQIGGQSYQELWASGEETTERAVKRVIACQQSAVMKEQRFLKVDCASAGIQLPASGRLLNAQNDGVTLVLLPRAGPAVAHK